MHCLELCLQVLVDLEGVSHVFVVHKLVWDLQRHKELGCVCLSLQVRKTTEQPVKNVLERAFLTVNNISAIVGVEVARISQYFKETAYAFFRFLLSFLLHVNSPVDIIKVREYFVHKFE